MSEPTYRIDLIHDPHANFKWSAHVHRLSDESLLFVKVGKTPREAAEAAREALAAAPPLETRQPIYLTEDGTPTSAPAAPEPQSLRA